MNKAERLRAGIMGKAWRVSRPASNAHGATVMQPRHGLGIGRALYAALFPALDSAEFRTVMAGIALPNPSSIRLHESFGVACAGVITLAGFKHERWINVGY